MNHLTSDLINNILNNINIKTSIKYIPYGDGEQNFTIFYKNKYPYNLVNKEWYLYYNLDSKL